MPYATFCRAFVLLLALVVQPFGFASLHANGIASQQPLLPVDELVAKLSEAKSDAQREAILEANKAKLTPELFQTLFTRGREFSAKQQWEQSLSSYQTAFQIALKLDDKARAGSALLEIGNDYFDRTDFNKALDYFEKSLALRKAANHMDGVASSLRHIAKVHRGRGDYTLALDYLQQAQALFGEIKKSIAGGVTIELALTHYAMGNFTEAVSAYKQALPPYEEIGYKEGMHAVHHNLGVIHDTLGEYGTALEYFGKALAFDESRGNKLILAATLNSIGNVYGNRGNHRLAMEHFEKSLQLSREAGNQRIALIAQSNIGSIYSQQGNYAQALDYFHRILALEESLGNKEDHLRMLLLIALTYRRQGDFDKAVFYAQRGLQLSEEIKSDSLRASALSELGSSLAGKAETGKALASFKEALSLFQNMNNEIGMCSVLANMALSSLQANKPQEALPVARQAAAIAKSKGNAERAWMSHTVLGEVFVSLNNFTQAREAFDEAITYVEMMRTQSAGDESELQRFFEGMVKPYYEMVKLMLAQNKNAEAFYYGERAKGRVLLDVLQNGRDEVKKAMSAEEREQEQKLRMEMASLNMQNAQAAQSPKPDQPKRNDLKARLQIVRLEYDAFRNKLYAAHPELKVKRGDAQIIKAEETAPLLPDANTALLSYLVVDNAAYLFVITKAPNQTGIVLKTYTLPVIREKLSNLVSAFRKQLAARDPEFRPSAKQLFDLLLKPAQAQLQGKTNLVISPDAALWELPFQTLLTGSSRYLIEEAAISYAPSLTVLREMTKQRKGLATTGVKTRLLAIGNPFISKETSERAKISRRDEKLDPLPEAEREVKMLAQIYGATQSRIYTGVEAREDRIKAEASDFKILHFATHGILNDAAPMYSYLVLAQGGKNEDGLLEAWELMETDLNADLVVLSACETARGRVGAGEGVIGLSWALFVAGSSTTVVSQWKVDSAGTSQLMLEFHKSLNAGVTNPKTRISKAGALRVAALNLLKSTEYRHPFYWAGFSVIGDGR